MMARSIGRAVCVVVLVLAGTACAESSDFEKTSEPTTVSLPDDVSDGPGGLLEAEVVPSPLIAGDVYRVRYRSTSVDGSPTEVTGLVARPSGSAPDGGFPVLSFAHGTTGIADVCAPSRRGSDAVEPYQRFLDAGWVVALTDYEGLGTPGVHPYLVAESEGRSVLDAVRAARELVPDTADRLVIGGHSQGGHAALAAASIAAEWAPELDVLGTIAVAPAADVGYLFDLMFARPDSGAFGLLIGPAWSATYPELRLDTLLSEAGLDYVDAAETSVCSAEIVQKAATSSQSVIVPSIDGLEPWLDRVDENSIDAGAVAGPVLVVQGTGDTLIPKVLSETLEDELCVAGVDAQYAEYPSGHVGVYQAALDDMVRWAQARLVGDPVATTCAEP